MTARRRAARASAAKAMDLGFGPRAGATGALALAPSEPVAPSAPDTPRRRPTGWRSWLGTAGPGLLVSVGYMDPGNWATDIEAGSRLGYALLFVVLGASLAAMFLQVLCVRLGLVASIDLASACRERFGPRTRVFLWAGAEIAIVACDLAEVLGGALGWHLLLGVSLGAGICLTALNTVVVLLLQGRGTGRLESIVLGLVATIGVCLAIELSFLGPAWHAVAGGLVPHASLLQDPRALYLAVGILGATVMPHNLYLHSALVIGTPDRSGAPAGALRRATRATAATMTLAFLVNAAILVLAAAAFHEHGRSAVTEIDEAFHLLDPLLGSRLAAPLFAVALLASGQSSTLTGTLAGQTVMDGFLQRRLLLWQRRLLTRALALLPAFLGVAWFGAAGVGKMLVLSQVVLSFQLPFAVAPLLRFTSDPRLMGRYASGTSTRCLGWLIFAAITAANGWLVASLALGRT